MAHSISRIMSIVTLLLALVLSQSTYAQRHMNSARTHADQPDKSVPLHVHLFNTEGADLGKPKYADTARAMANSAPHLLATDIVVALRHGGFSAVTLDESEGEPPADALNLTGRFTKLNPGNQNLRVWIGLGAGESKVCISGELKNASGKKLADFADCRNGLGWGSSGPQGDKSAEVLGDRVAAFLINWSQ
jgi:hypothetical protein